ncbi:helix-turn-helix domain-containing protein [Paraburkholderia xenovorans]
MNGLIALRKRLKMSQTDLGDAIGVTQSAISQYERGDCLMTPDVAIRLVQFARARGIAATMDALYMTKEAA